MRVRLLLQIIGINCLLTLPLTAANSIKIELCLDDTTKKNRDLLQNLLELDLLIMPNVETRMCGEKAKDEATYVFRQEVNEIDNGKTGRIEVKSALYSPRQKAIYGQLEFIERPSRKTMNDRARALAKALIEAINNDEEVEDPFLTVATKGQISTSDEPAYTQEHEDARTSPAHEQEPSSSFGFFVGMERFSQGGFTETVLISQEVVAIKPFLVIGLNFIHDIMKWLQVSASIRGGAAPLEFIRPLEKEKSTPKKISKMMDSAVEMAGVIPISGYLQLKAGLLIAGLFFDSDLKERVPRTLLSSFWQLRQGTNSALTLFLPIFDSKISVFGAYFPFIQNSQADMKPWRDFGWRIGLSAESTVYQSFGLQFALDHHREHFNGYVEGQALRVVSSSVLAYLGIVGKF